MKKVIGVIVLTLPLLFFSMASAEEKPAFNVGIKSWYNSWESGSVKSDPILMMGPSITLKLDKFFAGISYLTSLADYEFSDVLLSGDKLTGKRNDLDLVVGYMFHPRVGIVGGYKHISGDFTYTWAGFEGDAEMTVSGPVLGVTANYPIENTPAVLFGNLTYLSGEAEFTGGGGSITEDASGTTLDLGVAYSVSERTSVNLGYKHQDFEGDIFSGFTFGINFAF